MTFTLIAVDRARGLVGAATASRSLAVGNAVITVDPAVGVVASQAWTNRALRHRMLGAMAAGAPAQAAVDQVPVWDPEPALRQVAALDLHGGVAVSTGAATTAWAGHLVGPDHAALGNLLFGPDVLDAMVASFRASAAASRDDGPASALAFARRLVSALEAGDRAGGDARGRQSAAVVATRTSATREHPPLLDVDLRVDDHERPVAELERLLRLQAAPR